LDDKSIQHQDATVYRSGSGWGGAALNTVAWNAGPRTTFTVDGKIVDIHAFAGRIIQAWEKFFAAHNIA